MSKRNFKIDWLEQVTGWDRALNAARATVHKKKIDKKPSKKWEAQMLLAEHSPIRLVTYEWSLNHLQQWVTTHLVRHHIGCIPFVGTQRTDRVPADMDRDFFPQGLENDMMMQANAQALINISRKRLCNQASPETRMAWQEVIEEIRKIDPVMADKCVPECIYRGFCPEFRGCCGYCNTEDYKRKLKEYRSVEQYDEDLCN